MPAATMPAFKMFAFIMLANKMLHCNVSNLNASISNVGHGRPIEPMARISDRKFLRKVNYKDVIYFSDSHASSYNASNLNASRYYVSIVMLAN